MEFIPLPPLTSVQTQVLFYKFVTDTFQHDVLLKWFVILPTVAVFKLQADTHHFPLLNITYCSLHARS
jgi:hypothetical protein